MDCANENISGNVWVGNAKENLTDPDFLNFDQGDYACEFRDRIYWATEHLRSRLTQYSKRILENKGVYTFEELIDAGFAWTSSADFLRAELEDYKQSGFDLKHPDYIDGDEYLFDCECAWFEHEEFIAEFFDHEHLASLRGYSLRTNPLMASNSLLTESGTIKVPGVVTFRLEVTSQVSRRMLARSTMRRSVSGAQARDSGFHLSGGKITEVRPCQQNNMTPLLYRPDAAPPCLPQ